MTAWYVPGVAVVLKPPRGGSITTEVTRTVINHTMSSFPEVPRAPFPENGLDAMGTVARMIPYLKANVCPFCHGKLVVDVQDESVFTFCDTCHDFDVSVHMDIESKDVVLAYSSISGPEGFVEPDVLRSLESVLVRRDYGTLT